MFRDNFEAVDSTIQHDSSDRVLLVSNSDMSAFQKGGGQQNSFDAKALGLPGDDLIDMSAAQRESNVDAGEAQSGGDLSLQSKEIGHLLKGASKEDAGEAFSDFMEQNGDAMYQIAEAARPDDPLGYIAEQLNKELEGTDYRAIDDKKQSEVSIYTRSGDFVASVPVGPSLGDMLGIPQS